MKTLPLLLVTIVFAVPAVADRITGAAKAVDSTVIEVGAPAGVCPRAARSADPWAGVRRGWGGFGVLIYVATAFAVAVPPAAVAQDVADGERIWKTKAGCPQCHGWAGDGFPSGFHSEGNAPSLRETQLTRDQIRETIQCGRPGTPMPHFDRFAYTDKRCYDMTAADLGDLEPIRAPTTLQSYEIDAVADYVATKIKGAGRVTRAQCIEFFGEAGAQCDKYPERSEATHK